MVDKYSLRAQRMTNNLESAIDAHDNKMRDEMLKTYSMSGLFLDSTKPDSWTAIDQLEARFLALTRIVQDHIDYQVKLDISTSEKPSQCGLCSYCCYQNAWMTFTEGIYLTLWMKHRRMEFPDFWGTWKDIRNLPTERRFQKGIPCPLLKDNICSVYEARPSVCRGHHSASRLNCSISFANRKLDPQHWPEWEHLVLPKITAECTSIGLDSALLREGYQVGTGMLEEVMAQAIRGDTVERWLRKERVFKSHRSPDGHLIACQAVVSHYQLQFEESDGKPGNEPGTVRFIDQEDPGEARG